GSGSLYCSTKAALAVFTQSVGSELAASGEGVTINAICPDSFRAREGEELPGFEEMLKTSARTVDALLRSRRNGEVIPVASRRRLLTEASVELRKHASWLFKRK
ncbi:MAG: SDR family NAD(P)-dependent oxidoreductase, partial [Polyangiales bacterium]